MSQLRQKLQANQRVVTAEITPPKGAGLKKFLQRAESLKGKLDALNVTDCQRALVRMSSLAASRVLLDHGFEPVFQLTCRDRNSIAIQADLMGASALGIPNLLCLTGDPVKVGDSPKSKSVFEMETVGLLNIVQKLQNGRDNEGHKMNAPTKFFVGAVVNPSLSIGRSQFDRMAKKIEAGASFFQTQANYDNDDFYNFLAEARSLNSKVIAGILLLHSREMAEYIHSSIPGIRMPESVLNRFKEAADPQEAGIELAVETMRHLADVCDGFHLMSIRAEELIPVIMERYDDTRKIIQDSALSATSPAGS
jgi:methylenetetrahydrofolate reductase (NADPH)